MTPEAVAQCLAAYQFSPDEQVRQIAFRQQIAALWGVQPGQRILEVGCGQGDTTAVLASFVGPTGFVHGIDPGPPDYGAPATLMQAAETLKRSPLGNQIRIELAFQDNSSLPSDFDAAVLSMCSWYFASRIQLLETLETLRSKATRLFFAEWDPQPKFSSQAGHFLAVNLQSQVFPFQPDTDRNIRTAFCPAELRTLIQGAGWKIESEAEVEAPQVADGEWEVYTTLAMLAEPLEEVPEPLRSELKAQATHFEAFPQPHQSLPCRAYICR